MSCLTSIRVPRWALATFVAAALLPIVWHGSAVAGTAPDICQGDCDGGGSVSIGEVLIAASIFVGRQSVNVCPEADESGDGSVAIGEVLGCVRSYLEGCPRMTPTRTATPSPSTVPTATATRSATASPTPSRTPTVTPSVTASMTPSPARSATPSHSPTETPLPFVCGDGVIESGEECDDLNVAPRDGCGPLCRVERGWRCSSSSPSRCRIMWGKAYNVNEQSGTLSAASTDPAQQLRRGSRPAVADEFRVPGFPRDIDISRDGSVAFVTTRRPTERMAGGLAIVDLVARDVRDVIGAVGDAPEAVACHPDGSRVYVTDLSARKVTVVDTRDGAILHAGIDVGLAPSDLALTPRGDQAYVVNSSEDGSVSVIDTDSNTRLDDIPVGEFPTAVVCHPDGTHCFIANYDTSDVSIIDTRRIDLVGTVSVDISQTTESFPTALALDLDGSRLYVLLSGTNGIVAIDTARAIAGREDAVLLSESFGIGDQPFPSSIALTGGDGFALVTSFEFDFETGFPLRGRLTTLDLGGRQVVESTMLGELPLAVAVAPPPPVSSPPPGPTPTPVAGRRCGAVLCDADQSCELDRECHLSGGSFDLESGRFLDCGNFDRCLD